MNIVLLILKLMFFLRIFEEYGFLVQMVCICIRDLVPFMMTYFFFLHLFSLCYYVLHMEIDDDLD